MMYLKDLFTRLIAFFKKLLELFGIIKPTDAPTEPPKADGDDSTAGDDTAK